MADNYRFAQGGGGYYYPHAPQSHSRYHVRNTSPPTSARSNHITHDTPSPSQSQDLHSPAPNLSSMLAQAHQMGQNGRINGIASNQRTPMSFTHPHSETQPHQQHFSQNPQNMHQGHNRHNVNGSSLDDRHGHSVEAFPNSDHSFVSSSLLNGHSSTTRGGQAQQITEHWAEQIKLHKESENAHSLMRASHKPHFHARNKPGAVEIAPPPASEDLGSAAKYGKGEDRRRPLPPERANQCQQWTGMDMGGQGIHNLAPQVFHYTFLRELNIASNQLKRLPAAIGQLRLLQYFDTSFNQLTELPAELGMCVYLKTILVFNNRIRSLPTELGSLFSLEMLGIEGNQLDPGVRQEIMERGTKSLIHQFLEQAPVPPPPAPRSLHLLTPRMDEQESFKIFNYNILCDRYANPQQYPYVPSGALEWGHRKDIILRDIQTQDADIVCLQEVNTDSLTETFNTNLAHMDYKGVFWPKTRAKTMSGKEAKAVDGCVIYFKQSEYILLDKQFIDFKNIAINRPDMKYQPDIFNRVMPRDDIAVVVFLENRRTGSRMIVVNAHIFWNPEFADVKLIQVAIMMEAVAAMAKKYSRWPASKGSESSVQARQDDDESAETNPEQPTGTASSGGSSVPLLLCGDFNSTPDSGVYELLSSGHVAPDHPELGNYQYGDFTRDGIQHPFSLRSAYSLLDKGCDKMTFTNYTPGFQGVIDHIWYSTNAFEVNSLLGAVDAEYLKNVPGFPNYHFPSDHISILTEFSVKARTLKT